MGRQLPIISIAGEEFTVDIRLNEFRRNEAPWEKISFDDLQDHPRKRNYFVIQYDPVTKGLFDGREFSDRKDILLVTIPPLEILDPVGAEAKFTGKYRDEEIKPGMKAIPMEVKRWVFPKRPNPEEKKAVRPGLADSNEKEKSLKVKRQKKGRGI